MENNQQKWVNLSYIATALLLAYVVYLIAYKFSVYLDFEGRIRSLDKILIGASALIGLGLFIGLNKSSVANHFMGEVVAELGKVTWPTQEETTKGTFAVLVAVTVAGFILWMADSIWVYLIGLIV